MIHRLSRPEAWVWMAVIAYALGFVLFPPRVLLINDEERYVVQAVAFAHGARNVPDAALADSVSRGPASTYPPGTSLLQTPFVAVGGWRAAALLSVVGVALLALFTVRLLQAYDLNPAFALLVVAFGGTLLFGRVAMSDVPTAALVACALLLLERAETSRWQTWFLAGLACGSILLFRETVVVLLAPFVIVRLAKGDARAWALAAGGGMAVVTRLVLSSTLFGNAFFIRDPGFGFSLVSTISNLPMYALILLVLFPAGALLPFMYRGPKRPQFILALGLYAALFLSYDYNAWRDNGLLRGTLLSSRYMIPALPLLVVMAADVYPRLTATVFSARAVRAATMLACAAVALVAFLIHPAVRRLESQPVAIVSAIHDAAQSDILWVINEKAVGKYTSLVYGSRKEIPRGVVKPGDLVHYCQSFGGIGMIFLDRTDTDLFKADASQNAAFLAAASTRFRLDTLQDRDVGQNLRLRIYQSRGCQRA